MPKRKPSILRDWQAATEPDPLPTCYDARNPAMPWLPADESLFEDAEDREVARALCECGLASSTLGGCQKRGGPVHQAPAHSFNDVPVHLTEFSKTVLEQIGHKLASLHPSPET